MNEVTESSTVNSDGRFMAHPHATPPTPGATEACAVDCEGGHCHAGLRLRHDAWIYERPAWWVWLASLPRSVINKALVNAFVLGGFSLPSRD